MMVDDDGYNVCERRVKLCLVVSNELLVDLMESVVGGVAELALLSDGVKERNLVGAEVGQSLGRELANLVHVNLVKVAAHTAEKHNDFLLRAERVVLVLLEELDKTGTSVELLLGGSIEIRAELGESSNLTVLGKLELERAGNLLHGLDLGSRADTGHGQTDVDCRADTAVEKLSLKENLAVSDGNHVGRNVCRHITGLGLNDRERSQRAAAKGLGHLGSALKKTRVQVEDISRVRLTARRTTEQKRHLTVGHSLLGKIVVDDQRMLAVVSKVLTNRASRVGRKELQRSSLRRSRSNNSGVLHGTTILEHLHDLRNSRALLADGNVDAVKLLAHITRLKVGSLVENRVHRNRSLAGLTITNDQLTLATTNRHKRIDGLETGLHRLIHRLTRNNAGRLDLHARSLVGGDRALSIDRLTERIDDATEQTLTDWHIDDCACSLDQIAFSHDSVVTEHDHTDIVVLQVERHASESSTELHHLTCLNVLQSRHTSNSISNRQHSSNFRHIHILLKSRNLRLKKCTDLTHSHARRDAGRRMECTECSQHI
eukprot:comp21872_c0_seq1/m.49537 comp21872_c0_seq1/g.49537  ORF comp21872_c0_seq1/g.49537 comp21872_c0_seq1/m.49537 type:complete len:544 (+) comp21872_c0_seq1:1425-3056(+)